MPGLGRAGSNPAFDTSKFKRGLRLSLFCIQQGFCAAGFVCSRIIFFESTRAEQDWLCKAFMFYVDCCASVVFGVCVRVGMPTFLVRGLSGSQGAFE